MNLAKKRALIKLQTFLAEWGFGYKEWILGLNEALEHGGYNVGYKRKKHLHIVVDSAKIPWSIPKELENFPDLMPPNGHPFTEAYLQYSVKTGFDFSILAFTTEKFQMLKKYSINYDLSRTAHFLILTPLGVLKLEGLIWDAFLLYSPEKLQRIMSFYRALLTLAKKKRDKIIVTETTKLLRRYEKKIKKTVVNVSASDFDGTLKGTVGYKGKVTGRIWLIKDRDVVSYQNNSNILVAQMTSEKMIPFFKSIQGIITDEGGSLCHAAIISRELKIPCVIGTRIATQVFKDGDMVEMDATKGIIRKLNL